MTGERSQDSQTSDGIMIGLSGDGYHIVLPITRDKEHGCQGADGLGNKSH